MVHLHRRAGFAATWGELQRDLKAGPKESIDRLLKGKGGRDGVPEGFEDTANLLAESAVSSRDAGRLKALLAAMRSIEGVAGAYLANWRAEDESVILRVFLTGLQIDGLAARLLRADSSLTLLSVEPDAGRLAVEIPGRRGE